MTTMPAVEPFARLMEDHPTPWTARDTELAGWQVTDRDGFVIAAHLDARIAHALAAWPMTYWWIRELAGALGDKGTLRGRYRDGLHDNMVNLMRVIFPPQAVMP